MNCQNKVNYSDQGTAWHGVHNKTAINFFIKEGEVRKMV